MGKKRSPQRAPSGSKPNLGALQAVSRPPIPKNQKFEPLPPPAGSAPFHATLSDFLPKATVDMITKANKLVIHCVGDTGGINQADPQVIVANHMVADLGTTPSPDAPSFFYHLGDVVYFYGEHEHYYPQFYEPYSGYSAPILPIPGNHDGDIPPHANIRSLDAFVENFCAKAGSKTPESGDTTREAATLPNVYWTLETPFATMVGAYTNVPDGGRIQADQQAWLTKEFKSAPADRALVVAFHHPVISLDSHHSGSAYVHQALDAAAKDSGRIPDLVLTAHVHNYQRFTRQWNGRSVPVIVAGAGGYPNLHYMTHNLGWPIKLPFKVPPAAANGMQATLEAFSDDHHGYLILELAPKQIKGTYFTVPRPQDPWRDPAAAIDSFVFNLATHSLASKPAVRPASTGGTTGIGVSGGRQRRARA
jgi:acid phosphatase type 7